MSRGWVGPALPPPTTRTSGSRDNLCADFEEVISQRRASDVTLFDVSTVPASIVFGAPSGAQFPATPWVHSTGRTCSAMCRAERPRMAVFISSAFGPNGPFSGAGISSRHQPHVEQIPWRWAPSGKGNREGKVGGGKANETKAKGHDQECEQQEVRSLLTPRTSACGAEAPDTELRSARLPPRRQYLLYESWRRTTAVRVVTLRCGASHERPLRGETMDGEVRTNGQTLPGRTRQSGTTRLPEHMVVNFAFTDRSTTRFSDSLQSIEDVPEALLASRSSSLPLSRR